MATAGCATAAWSGTRCRCSCCASPSTCAGRWCCAPEGGVRQGDGRGGGQEAPKAAAIPQRHALEPAIRPFLAGRGTNSGLIQSSHHILDEIPKVGYTEEVRDLRFRPRRLA